MQTYKVTVDEFKTIRWYNDKDQPHRLDGPAREWVNGHKSWWVNGKRHRLDGPALECADGIKEWWVEGKHMTKEEFDEYMNPKPKPTCEGKIVEVDGIKYKLVKACQ